MWEIDDVMAVTPARGAHPSRLPEHPTNRKDREGGREGSARGGGIMCYERAGSRCDSRAPTHLTHNSARQQEALVWSTNGASLLLFTVTESTSEMSETQKHELLLLVLLVETCYSYHS